MRKLDRPVHIPQICNPFNHLTVVRHTSGSNQNTFRLQNFAVCQINLFVLNFFNTCGFISLYFLCFKNTFNTFGYFNISCRQQILCHFYNCDLHAECRKNSCPLSSNCTRADDYNTFRKAVAI